MKTFYSLLKVTCFMIVVLLIAGCTADDVKELVESEELREVIDGAKKEVEKAIEEEIDQMKPDENGNEVDPFLPPPYLTTEVIDNAVKWSTDMEDTTWPKSDGYYGNCLLFVHDAYVKGANFGIKGNYGSATNAAAVLGAHKNIDLLPPPKGSWVFYSVEHDIDGHAALALDNGRIIHVNTDEPTTKTATVEEIGYSDLEPYGILYIGWAWPEK